MKNPPTVIRLREEVKAFSDGSFDLILMEVQMPEVDGFKATCCIRESELPTRRHTPMVAMTANAMAGDGERCLAAGMDDYPSKLLNKSPLLAIIEQISIGLKDRDFAITGRALVSSLA